MSSRSARRTVYALRPTALTRLARAALACTALALTGPLAPNLAHAQDGQVARHYALSGAPLAVVLTEFARSAGVVLSFDASALRGRQSAGLQGTYTIDTGFAKLLAGSGYQVLRDGDGNYRLAPAPAESTDSAATLPPVRVTARTRATAETENTGAFAARKATVFRGVESLKDIPQPVTVLTRQFLEDRALPDLHDVLQNTPGVAVDYVDSERVTYFSRGHQIDSLQIDGLSINQSGSSFIQPDTAVLDRVEVLRGASGMLRGAGQPSATVNMVRKRPTRELQTSASAGIGSWQRRRIEGDVSGPMNPEGTLRGRLVAVSDEKEFFQKARSEDRKVLYGVFEADLTSRTQLTASLQHTDLDATGAWGNMPANFDGSPLNLPRETYLGAAWNQWNRYNRQAFTELAHRFDNGWTAKLSGAYTQLRLKEGGFKQSYFTRPSGATNPYLMNVTTSVYTGNASDQRALVATADGPVELFGRKHQLVLGVENVRSKVTESWGIFNLSPLNGVDIRDWDPYTSYPEVSYVNTGVPTRPSYTRQQGAFATARVSLADSLAALIGGRLSWWEYEAASGPAGNYDIGREVTPYVGLVYDINPQLSAYGSYTEIFTPQSAQGANGAVLEPIRGEDYEAGIKGEFLQGRLTASLSLFRIDNVGKALLDTATPNACVPSATNPDGYCNVAGGRTRSQGWEMEVAGEVTPGWDVMAGYTNTRTRYIADASASNIGKPLRSQDPRQQLRLFTTYRLAGVAQGWKVGGGADIRSETSATAGGLTARHSGYAIYNAMLGYQINDHYALQLNVNNVFDKVYYKKYSPTGISTYYGDPRNAMATLRVKF